jgi:uncharacterized membrane protein
MEIIDNIVIVLFVFFMIFIFAGYHKTKSEKREREFKKEALEKEENLK